MVPTRTLIIAVVVPVTVLVLVSALICWLGIRRQWFVKRERKTASTNFGLSQDDSSDTVREESSNDTAIKGHSQPSRMTELYTFTPPHLLASTEVHQLHGDGLRRISAT
jgi:hypothetical protein